MDLLTAQGLPPESLEWDTEQWLPHFAAQAEGDRQSCYIFDFANPPKVRGDSSGFVDAEGKLWLVAETPCPECFRPTTVLFHRWNMEPADVRNDVINQRMQDINWHTLHPQRKKKS